MKSPSVIELQEGLPFVDAKIGSTIIGVLLYDLRDNLFVDDRGMVFVLEDYGEDIRRVYMTTAGKGVIKAWHKHNLQTDRLCVISGKAKIGLWDLRSKSRTCENMIFLTCSMLNPMIVVIPTGVAHGYMPLEDNTLIINCPDRSYNSDDEIKLNDGNFSIKRELWEVRDR